MAPKFHFDICFQRIDRDRFQNNVRIIASRS